MLFRSVYKHTVVAGYLLIVDVPMVSNGFGHHAENQYEFMRFLKIVLEIFMVTQGNV